MFRRIARLKFVDIIKYLRCPSLALCVKEREDETQEFWVEIVHCCYDSVQGLCGVVKLTEGPVSTSAR